MSKEQLAFSQATVMKEVDESLKASISEKNISGFEAQVIEEIDHEIKYRTCSWQKVKFEQPLLAYEYLVLSSFILLDSSTLVFGLYRPGDAFLSMVTNFRRRFRLLLADYTLPFHLGLFQF